MVYVNDEARALVSALVKEAQEQEHDTNSTGGLAWLLPPQPDDATVSQADSADEWDLKEVRWAQHADILSKLVHLTNYWASLVHKPMPKTPVPSMPLFTSSTDGAISKSAPCTTTLTSTIPTPTVRLAHCCLANSSVHPPVSLVDVLCSLSGQLELFYTMSHGHLQSLRYYCFYTFAPDMRQSIFNAVDKAYENLVLGVMKCFRVAHCLKVAHATHPDTFLDRCVSQLPTVFTLSDDDSQESPMNHSVSKQENEKCSRKDGTSSKRPIDDAQGSEGSRVGEGIVFRSHKRHRSTLEHEATKMQKHFFSLVDKMITTNIPDAVSHPLDHTDFN